MFFIRNTAVLRGLEHGLTVLAVDPALVLIFPVSNSKQSADWPFQGD